MGRIVILGSVVFAPRHNRGAAGNVGFTLRCRVSNLSQIHKEQENCVFVQFMYSGIISPFNYLV
jgi:hypothetical protein